MDPSCVSPLELLMSLNRRMCDCDKLIDSFCGNTSVLITGNAVQLAHIRSLTCSHNNTLTQSGLFFSFATSECESTPINGVEARMLWSSFFNKKGQKCCIQMCFECIHDAIMTKIMTKNLIQVSVTCEWKSHLCLHVGQLPRLLCGLTQQVGSDFYHCGCVVVHSSLLDLDHVVLHAVLYVVLELEHDIKTVSVRFVILQWCMMCSCFCTWT